MTLVGLEWLQHKESQRHNRAMEEQAMREDQTRRDLGTLDASTRTGIKDAELAARGREALARFAQEVGWDNAAYELLSLNVPEADKKLSPLEKMMLGQRAASEAGSDLLKDAVYVLSPTLGKLTSLFTGKKSNQPNITKKGNGKYGNQN